MTGRLIVLLGHPYDSGTRRVRTEIGSRSATPALLLTPELVAAAGWWYRLDAAGRARTELRLPNGRRVTDDAIGCVLNRWDHLPAPRLRRPSERDAEYGALEFQSLVASWLGGLGDRVVNRAGAHAVDVGPRTSRAWLVSAVEAGLPVAASALATTARRLPDRVTGRRPVRPLGRFMPAGGGGTGRVPVEIGWSASGLAVEPDEPDDEARWSAGPDCLVVGDRVLDAPTEPIGRACVGVAAAAGCAIAGFRFDHATGGPALCRVTTRPSLIDPRHAVAVAEFCVSLAARTEALR